MFTSVGVSNEEETFVLVIYDDEETFVRYKIDGSDAPVIWASNRQYRSNEDKYDIFVKILLFSVLVILIFILELFVVIEVLNREYGDHTERMIMAVDNGRIYRWNKPVPSYRSNNDIKSDESEY